MIEIKKEPPPPPPPPPTTVTMTMTEEEFQLVALLIWRGFNVTTTSIFSPEGSLCSKGLLINNLRAAGARI